MKGPCRERQRSLAIDAVSKRPPSKRARGALESLGVLENLVKRREPSSEQTDKGLRAQFTRAVGGSIDVIRSVLPKGQKSVDVPKQRLSDVLWNDRTMLATAELSTRAAQQEAAERELEHEAVLLEPESGVTAAPPRALSPSAVPPPLPGAAALAEAVANGAPRARVDTPRQSEAMRARLEATKARVAAKVPAMPKGIAPLAAAESKRGDATPKPDDNNAQVDQVNQDALVSLQSTHQPESVASRAPVTAPPPLPVAVAAPSSTVPPPVPAVRSSAAAPPPLPAAAPATASTRASPPPPPAPRARRAAPPPADDDDDEEPICTRSMARLLAGQGHRDRALRIYDTLLAADGSDESLRAEADALRRAG